MKKKLKAALDLVRKAREDLNSTPIYDGATAIEAEIAISALDSALLGLVRADERFSNLKLPKKRALQWLEQQKHLEVSEEVARIAEAAWEGEYGEGGPDDGAVEEAESARETLCDLVGEFLNKYEQKP